MALLLSSALMKRNVHQFVSSLRGQRLRQFKSSYRQLTENFRLWTRGEGDKVPEGFGKFYPKSGKGKAESDAKTPHPKPSKPESDASKPREIEFKFSFGSSKTGGGGGGGGPGGKPLDPNMWTMIGFFGTVSALMAFSFFKMR